MSLDSAIANIGEYYAVHYLAEQFPKDIADRVKAWKEQGSRSVPRRLQALSDGYFRAKAQALEIPDPLQRLTAKAEALAAWHGQLLDALGYAADSTPETHWLDLTSEKSRLPARALLHRHQQPWLAICETPFCLGGGEQDEEPLELPVSAPSWSTAVSPSDWPILDASWEKAIARLFAQEDRPRWLMLLAGSRVYLFDAHTYAQGRYLAVDLDDAFARKQARTFEAIAALLARVTLAPEAESDEVLHERLRQGSQRSTHGVSAKLQAAVRAAIADIANGWVEARRARNLGYRQLGEREDPLPDGSRAVTAEQLRHEALVYVYRLLFCLYAEARGSELGVLPMTDGVYRLGYSLEALRDLADRGEPGTTSENGTYDAEHLERLFGLIHQGFHPEAEDMERLTGDDQAPWRGGIPTQLDLFGGVQAELALDDVTVAERKRTPPVRRAPASARLAKTFIVQPLTATLFAPTSTPLLDRVRLPNRVLHRVIRALSLGTGERGRQIGRINYAELGINQLGAVYEGLLSYKGFFATQDLIQVLQRPKDGKPVFDDDLDPAIPTWLTPAERLEDFKPGEVVLESRTRQPRIYKTGEFILHLNGVDRVNSASYYTPAVLTQALVRETLNERLKDIGPAEADRLLGLKICEPAMGSAAFLVEAIGQLADRYLDLKQKQVGTSIDPGDYADQRRRVMHAIAVDNLYGVDLNPTAVELGALSLWLATIHRLPVPAPSDDEGAGNRLSGSGPDEDVRSTDFRSGATPWLGLRLRPGNSLIGARRAVWTERQLLDGTHLGADAQAPRQLKPGESRKPEEIYHFLVWGADMTPAARDKLMRSFWPEPCKAIGEWHKTQVKAKWTREQLGTARRLCERIDRLWEAYARERAEALERSRCSASVWPQTVPQDPSGCLEKADGSGQTTLAEREAIKARLESESSAFQRLKRLMDAWCALYFWPLEAADSLPSRAAWLDAAEVLVAPASSRRPEPAGSRFHDIARAIAEDQPFHHWELVFTEVLGPGFEGQREPPRGFDLMFGNPPWIKVSWNDAPLLAEFSPLLGVREAKSATYNRERATLLADEGQRRRYRKAFEQGEGAGVFLNDRTLYPSLAGVQTNLYKNFIERSWGLLGGQGVAGLLHPEGVFDDPKGGVFREGYYRRLLGHYQLRNERNLFNDVHHVMGFSLNIYRGQPGPAKMRAMFNLFDTATIDHSQRHQNPHDPIPGIKSDAGAWETRGHRERILTITEHELGLFARLFEDAGTPPLQARLPQVHSRPLLAVLEKFAAAPRRLGDLKGDYFATEMFHESNAQRDGLITREADPTFQPRSADDWVVSGPHFFVGNPLNRTPRTQSLGVKGADYDDIDLTEIPDDYLPRALYRPGDRDGDPSAFLAAIPEWPRPRRPENVSGGFWPIRETDLPAWEALLGEPLRLYGVDPSKPGARTARQFGYFVEWEGDVEDAMRWLLANEGTRNSEAFANRFSAVRLSQGRPDADAMLWLPRPLTAFHRYAHRRRGHPANERTLMPAILPAGFSHIHPVFSIAFLRYQNALLFGGCAQSILWDFLVRVGGRGDIYESTLLTFPLMSSNSSLIIQRVARLTCLTTHYADLWSSAFDPAIRDDAFTCDLSDASNRDGGFRCAQPTLQEHQRTLRWSELTPEWQRGCALRTERERRQALLEIDVLVALALNLTPEELIQIYSVQFPVMGAYEEADRYDATGRRLPNTTRKDPGAKELREALTHHDGTTPVTVSWTIDNGNQTRTRTFHPPFVPVDRIDDYRRAWAVFTERLGLS
ncbi:hypothetical protein G3480_06005 [Thiorhodococcus mannitoliphagus]|uniref:site-specific DNA-methyltransferase (adenine-specific) n=1 Tax=Thiorhodococcus mannitoliphagus TaxID=329406 RepID=A0A6P1DSH0_9GAMM|nr:hypothetical protein [Thiorhodococcus mannitoliphagus]NEX19871.1 hypothetical protein [Thiorhodococcus mannitoliphagus]